MSFGSNDSGYGPGEDDPYRGYRAQPSSRPPRIRRASRLKTALRRPDAPLVTYGIIAACVVIWLLQLVVPGFTNALVFFAPFTHAQPWRIITGGFAHSTSTLLHLPLNMYTLWIFGMMLEPILGRWRYATVYLLSMVGGWISVALLAPATPVLGASGALFGLMAALMVIVRHLGGQYIQLLVLLGVNLLFGFLGGGVSWQAHVGGLVVGLVLGMILARTRYRVRSQTIWLSVCAVVLVVGLWMATDPSFLAARLIPGLQG